MTGWITSFSLTDVLVVCAVVGYAIRTFAEERGWLRSTRVLRVENKDLVRRNSELEETVKRHTEKLEEQSGEIQELRGQIVELKARDQAAVLAALQKHEVEAERRYGGQVEVLKQIRDLLVTRSAA